MTAPPEHDSKTKLLDAALQVIRIHGYAATTVDDVCIQAGASRRTTGKSRGANS